MSFKRVTTDTNNFGYRLLTSDGDVTPLKYSDIDKYRADDRDELVLKTLNTQSNALAGLDIPVIIAAKGGSIIIASDSATAEKASAAAFPVSEYDRTPRQAIRAVQKAEGLKENLLNSFDFAASGQFVPAQLPTLFAFAARVTDNVVRPVFATDNDEMRLAA